MPVMAFYCLCFCSLNAHAQTSEENDSTEIDLPLPHGGRMFLIRWKILAVLGLDWPGNFNYEVVYDPITGQYIVQHTIGDTLQFRPSSLFSLDEFLNYDINGNLTEFWNQLQEEDDEANTAPKLEIDNVESFENVLQTLMKLKLSPKVQLKLVLGINSSNTENPRIPKGKGG